MNASQLISVLQEIIQECGDLPVTCDPSDIRPFEIAPFTADGEIWQAGETATLIYIEGH